MLPSPKRFAPLTARLLYHHLALAARQQAPLAEVIDILAQDSQLGRRQTSLLSQLAAHQRQHATLTEAMACMPRAFAPQTIALVRQAEQTQCLPLVLDQLSADEEHRLRQQAATRGALVWPLTILWVLFALAVIVLIFVLPAFSDVFNSFGAELPAATQGVLMLADVLVDDGGWVMVALVLALLRPRRLARISPLAADLLWRVYLLVPVVRAFFLRAHAARLANWLRALHSDRATLSAAITHLAATAAISPLHKPMLRLASNLHDAPTLSAALTGVWGIPKGLVLSVRLGESSQDMPGAMQLASELAYEQADFAAQRLGRWMFIGSYIMVIVLAWWFVLAMYLPIFKLGTVV